MTIGGGYDDEAFVADFYDHVVPYRERQDVAFFVEEALAAGGPVLEVGCGTGRVLLPTARAGVTITGLDLSSEMLRVCRKRLAAEPVAVQERVRLVQADMREFDLGQAFKLITLPFRPFQHLTTVADQIACLTTIRRHLQPDGRLILDIFNPSLTALTRDNVGETRSEEPPFSLPDGSRVVRRNRIVARDTFAQVIQVELIYDVTHADGSEERLVHAFAMRYLFRFEVEHLLARCGFAVAALYGDYDRSAYGTKEPGELIFIARPAAPGELSMFWQD